MNAELIISVLTALIPVVMAAIAPFVIRYLNSLNAKAEAELGVENFHLLTGAARTAVEAAEQFFKNYVCREGEDFNEKKKEFAVYLVIETANIYNVPLSTAGVDALIEAAVKAMNIYRDALAPSPVEC